MNLLKKIKAKKNSAKLLDHCLFYIQKYEQTNTKTVPSCADDMKEILSQRISRAYDEIAEWEDYDTDYIKIAHTMLAHASFDLLASGSYHIYYGVLNPMSCSSNLMTVYNKVMEWGVAHNLLDAEEKESQYRYLLQCISEVG